MSRPILALFQRRSGNLKISPLGLTFRAPAQPHDNEAALEIFISRDNARFVLSGTNRPYLHMCQGTEIPLVAEAKVALDALLACGYPVEALRATLRRRVFWRRFPILAAITIIPFLYFIVPVLLSRTPLDWLNRALPLSKEIAFFRIKEIDPKETGPTLEKMLTYVKQHNPDDLSDLDIRVSVHENGTINAYAAPGGVIIFEKNLLRDAKSIEEVYGVMAHEIAHVKLRHLLRSYLSSSANFFAWIIGQIVAGNEVMSWVDFGTKLNGLSYSRNMEREADLKAASYLDAANIPISGMASFFERMAAKNDSSRISLPGFLSTHPTSVERVKYLRSLSNPNGLEAAHPYPGSLEEL